MRTIYEHNEKTHNYRAPLKVLPPIIHEFNISSVIDIGTGIGTWLSVAQQNGIEDYIGIDGDWVKKEMLKIPLDKFFSHDLSTPLVLNRKYDLAICLEVAEHLSESSADTLVQSIVRHSGLILFSAAVPGQGGQNHLNEQPPLYWEKKFNQYGYMFFDIIRPNIWNDDEIEWWYKQNIFVVSNRTIAIQKNINHSNMYIHPDLFYDRLNKIDKISKKYSELKSGKYSSLMYFKLFLKSLAK